ncbi:MAG: UvrD-helicase domain-containing protein [Polyangiaceae bacterium]
MTLDLLAPKKILADAEARDRIANDLDATLVVEAAAGTGKTTALVGRIMALLASGKGRLSTIVAVTFTEKAAGEMKLRLRTEIEKAREVCTADILARLDGALAELEAAHIGTIHGFCADLLRDRPVEARVDPLFEMIAEDEQSRLLEECFEPWFELALRSPVKDRRFEGVRRLLRRRSRRRNVSGPRELLRKATFDLVEWRHFSGEWRRDPFDREGSIDRVVAKIDLFSRHAEHAAEREKNEDWLAKSIMEISRWRSELARREAVLGSRDYDGLEAELRTLERERFWNWKGRGKVFSPGVSRDDVLNERTMLKEELSLTLQKADADLAVCLRRELTPLAEAYEDLKRRAGRLDFLDLLLRVRDMLQSDRKVRAELQKKFTHLLVDEFQDTDPLQAEILLLLAASDPNEADFSRVKSIPGKLFVVGDPKQSIYRFRRADVTLYEATKKQLLAAGAVLLHLTTSFRSVPSIQNAVNAAFSQVMHGSEDGSQASYVALTPFRDEPKGRPTVIALPVPRPYADYGKIADYIISESFPDAVGAFVDFLITKSGWTIAEKDSDIEVPIEARHVCLLFKRFQSFGEDVTRPYVRALEARRIPHVLVGGRSFHHREEVTALRNAASAIEWPDDELSVFATLRGPFIALSDAQLLTWRTNPALGSLHPFKKIDETKLTDFTRPVHEALGLIAKLHRGRNRRPIADTLGRFLEATRAHAGIAIWPTGEQALANVLRVLDLARRFETTGATSFRAFVSRLDDDAERGTGTEAAVVEEGTEGVRIMTVHRAKGLEFPIVVLVDPTAPPALQNPTRYVPAATSGSDKRVAAIPLAGCVPVELFEHRDEVLRHDREEAQRLVYVAATRARELLVVPVVGDEPAQIDEDKKNWLDVLRPVVFPASAQRRDARQAPGTPTFGSDSTLERPASARTHTNGSVAPGLHRPSAGEHQVVWWDPRALELDREHDVGLRQQKMLAADDGNTAVDEGGRLHDTWAKTRQNAITTGSTPHFRIVTVTERKAEIERGATASAEVPVEATTANRKTRAHGKRFGILVHAVLANVELDANAEGIALVARAQGRLIGATPEEEASAVEATIAALAHPLMQRARNATDVRREASVSHVQEDGSLLEGVVDLTFREESPAGPKWTIVDFKTDVELSSRRAEYALQVSLYARALEAATGEKAEGALLSV